MSWIKLSDQEPPLETPILVTNGEDIQCCEITDLYKDIPSYKPNLYMRAHGYLSYDGEWLFFELEQITHWQPLPELPGKELNTSFEDDTRPYADDEIGLDTDSA